jgi:hypothetical protein
MTTIVVSGSGRNVGKTTLVCGLIAALPEFRWTAVKTTSHAHGNGEPVWEETAAGQGSDTARFLAAGARRALLVAATGEGFPMAEMRAALGRDAHLIFESNRILDHIEADVCLAVVGGDEADVKPAFAGCLRHADGIVVRAARHAGMVDLPASARIFELEDFAPISLEMMDWLTSRLGAADGN